MLASFLASQLADFLNYKYFLVSLCMYVCIKFHGNFGTYIFKTFWVYNYY